MVYIDSFCSWGSASNNLSSADGRSILSDSSSHHSIHE